MRGADSKQEAMLNYVSPEARVPVKHPLWSIRAMISEALSKQWDGRPHPLTASAVPKWERRATTGTERRRPP